MGYTTQFDGVFHLSRRLTEDEKKYINSFSKTRRMKRDVKKLMELHQGKYGYPFPMNNTPEAIYGKDGEYFVGIGQEKDGSIIDYNTPPGQVDFADKNFDFNERLEENEKRISRGECQPGLWCDWIVTSYEYENEDVVEWDGGAKFYRYCEWIKYLINHFFSKWGVLLNGNVVWSGEEIDDRGRITIADNVVDVQDAVITYVSRS